MGLEGGGGTGEVKVGLGGGEAVSSGNIYSLPATALLGCFIIIIRFKA